METLNGILARYSSEILLTVSLLSLLLLGMVIALSRRVRRDSAKWRSLMEGAQGENLERILYDHLRERLALQGDVAAIERRTSELEEKMRTSKRFVGLVRYDAFEDVGGSQSFALAVYDDRGDGAVITSLIGRADCRVYCKPLIGGRSERTLSQEEQRAIDEARSVGPKAMLSP